MLLQPIPDLTADTTPRWPTAMALLAPLIALPLPGLVARRLDRVPLAMGWAVHVITSILSLVLFILLMGVNEMIDRGWGYGQSVVRLLYRDILPSFDTQDEIIFGLIAIAFEIAVYEAGLVLVGVVFMAWCARPEPWNRSFARSLNRVYLAMSHAWVYAFPLWVLHTGYQWLQQNWRWTGQSYPWWLRDGEVVLVNAWALMIGLGLLAALWVMHGGSWRAYCSYPPDCENCGYSTMGLAKGSPCPECGHIVTGGASNAARERTLVPPGTPALVAWPANLAAALFRPGRLGHTLCVYTPTRGRLRLMLATLGSGVVAMTIGFILLSMTIAIVADEMPWEAWAYGWGLSTAIVVAVMAVLILAGMTLAGTLARVFTRRNLLTLAAQAGSCLGPMFAVAVVTLWVLICVWVIVLEAMSDSLGWGVLVIGPWVGFLGVVVISGGTLLLYIVMTSRITWAGRFASA